jgi:hypothetical protein
MSDEEFSAFLTACRNELASLQPTFQQRIHGGGRWFYDLSDCHFALRRRVLPDYTLRNL